MNFRWGEESTFLFSFFIYSTKYIQLYYFSNIEPNVNTEMIPLDWLLLTSQLATNLGNISLRNFKKQKKLLLFFRLLIISSVYLNLSLISKGFYEHMRRCLKMLNANKLPNPVEKASKVIKTEIIWCLFICVRISTECESVFTLLYENESKHVKFFARDTSHSTVFDQSDYRAPSGVNMALGSNCRLPGP